MQLLTRLTLIYAGVLVAALALALVTICALLWRVSFVLADVRKTLESAADLTAPLDRQLTPVGNGAAAMAEALKAARFDLARAVEHLEVRTGRLARRAAG